MGEGSQREEIASSAHKHAVKEVQVEGKQPLIEEGKDEEYEEEYYEEEEESEIEEDESMTRSERERKRLGAHEKAKVDEMQKLRQIVESQQKIPKIIIIKDEYGVE